MLEGKPFLKLHAKAAETKYLLQPVAAVLRHLANSKPAEREVVELMLMVLDSSHQIDILVDSMVGYKVWPGPATECRHSQTLCCFPQASSLPFQFCTKEPLSFPPCPAWEAHVPQAGLVLPAQRSDAKDQALGCRKLSRHTTQEAWNQGPGEILGGSLPCTVFIVS